MPAYAFNGPNVSMGSNPIAYTVQQCNPSSYSALYTNKNTTPFIITDIIIEHSAYDMFLRIDGIPFLELAGGRYDSHMKLKSRISVEPGSTLTCKTSGENIFISGYYTH